MSMGSRFILFEHGYPELADELWFRPLRKRDVATRWWEGMHAVDELYHYRLCVDDPPKVTRLQRFLVCTLAELGWNPKVELSAEWRTIGPYSKDVVVTQITRGLETDDDIITQFFHGDDVLKLVNAAEDFSQMVLAMECIAGAHEFEVNEEARQYVMRVVGQLGS